MLSKAVVFYEENYLPHTIEELMLKVLYHQILIFFANFILVYKE
jgi:hypothetical protein